MENNKWYLQKIHWVFLIALAFGTLNAYYEDLMAYLNVPFQKFILFADIFKGVCLFSSLGIVTGKWKPALAGFITSAAILLSFYFADLNKFTLTRYLIGMLVTPIPLLVFFGLLNDWRKKMITVYFLILVAECIYALSYYAPEGINRFTNLLFENTGNTRHISMLPIKTAVFVFQIFVCCELSNYLNNKEYNRKSNLLNLGNHYSKFSGIITYWTLKVILIVIGVGSIFFIGRIREYFIGYEYSFSQTNVSTLAMKVSGIVTIITTILMLVAFTWYFRKFLLEYFISHGIKSKFLFWLCTLPIIGLFAFLILQIDATSEKNYTAKKNSLSDFAANSTYAVTVVFVILYCIRLLTRISSGQNIFIISLIISLLLFYLVITYKNAYVFTLVLTLILLTLSAFAILLINWEGAEIATVFGLLIFNVFSLMLIYPIYHIEQFEYIPATNPASEPEAKLASE